MTEACNTATLRRLDHDGHLGELLPIAIKNIVFKMLTLGFYQFWATTNVRRYLWSRTSFDSDPIEWTGSGKELFKGFVAVFFLVLLPLVAIQLTGEYLLENGRTGLGIGLKALSTIIALLLLPLGLYRARRYRLSRTVWRGIRGTQIGSAWKFAFMWLGWMLAASVSGGLVAPLRDAALIRYKLNNTVFGDQPFISKADGGALYPAFLTAMGLCVLWVVLTIGLGALFITQGLGAKNPASIWVAVALGLFGLYRCLVSWMGYAAACLRHYAETTRWGGLTFRIEADSSDLLWLLVPNFFIVLLTLGFGLPLAQLRKARFVARHLQIIGDQNFASIGQSRAVAPTAGEGLVTIFDGVDL